MKRNKILKIGLFSFALLVSTLHAEAYFSIGTGFNSNVHSLTLQSDGKILVGGAFTTLNGVNIPDYLVRLNTDGTVDSTFSTNLGTGFSGEVRSTILQSDGKILVGGAFTTLNGVNIPDYLVRLNTDGTVDSTFSTNLGTGFNGIFIEDVSSLTLQSDGKIIVGGNFETLNGVNIPDYLVRLNTDGTVDSTFSTNLGTGFSGEVRSTILQSDGKILVGGVFTTLNGVNIPDYLVRINTDGTVDGDAPPTLTILGSNPASVIKGSSYSDAGATASDISSGDLTSSIITTNNVNINVAGAYTVVYQVTDSNSNIVSTTRDVTVSSGSSGGSSSSGGGGGGGKTCKRATASMHTLKPLALTLTMAPTLKEKNNAPSVKILQKFLNGIGCVIKKSGATSPYNETTIFTKKTKAALHLFQKTYKIVPADGTLNPVTRAYIQKTYAQGIQEVKNKKP